MNTERKDRICALLKGIETGDAAAVGVINPQQYIQHNPQTQEGGEGLAVLFQRLSRTSPRVNIARIFADGDYVFGHTEYDFSSRRIGFEVFRFEGDQAVEHWDNIQPRMGPNRSGRTMVDGAGQASDPERTESNRNFLQSFIDDVLIGAQFDVLARYIDEKGFAEHNPSSADGLPALAQRLSESSPQGGRRIQYKNVHRVLAEGDFVLSVCEGAVDDVHTAFYDLFRVAGGKIVEHWDTTEAIPPQSEWKNDNGKF